MSNIRYVVSHPNEHDYKETEFSLHETHDEAMEFVNELMHDADIQFCDGQEQEFLEMCAEHPHTWGEIGLYDLWDDEQDEKVGALGFNILGIDFMV